MVPRIDTPEGMADAGGCADAHDREVYVSAIRARDEQVVSELTRIADGELDVRTAVRSVAAALRGGCGCCDTCRGVFRGGRRPRVCENNGCPL